MTSVVPDLDVTTFEQLVERARGQIPRFAPGWTDHNLHDPGITLLDLLAWVVDQQVYRVGFVGDRYLAAFAALLGAAPSGPIPARGLLWPRRTLASERALGAGTPVMCASEPELPFVLEQAVHVTPARLIDLVVDGEGTRVAVPHEGARTAPISLAPAPSGGRTTLTLRFDRPLLEKLPGRVSVGFVVEPPPGEPPDPDVHSWGPLRFEHRRSVERWATADLVADGTSALARTGAVIVEVPTSDGMTSADPSELRLVLDTDAVPLERRVRRVEVNVLPVVQTSLDKSALGVRGTGLPDQVVTFGTKDVVDVDALEVRVADEVWESRPTLLDAGPNDRAYVRRPDALVFGNGVNGRVPPLDAVISTGPVARTLGDRVRVRAGLAWNVPALDAEGDAFATTVDAIGGGRARTDGAGLLAAARHIATTRKALLTDEELAAAARLLPGFAVARAEVLDGFHPDVPEGRIEGSRTLVVIPHRSLDIPASAPRPAYVEAVRRLLAERRVLGDQLVVAGHSVVAVSVRLALLATPGTDLAAVREGVAAGLRARFSDVARNDAIAPWPLGRTVTCEEVTAIASGCDGVLAVKSCAVGRAGGPTGEEPIEVDRDAVAVVEPDDLRIEVVRS